MRTGNFKVAIRQHGIVSDWNVAGKRKVCEDRKRRAKVFTPRAQFFHNHGNTRPQRSSPWFERGILRVFCKQNLRSPFIRKINL